MAMHARKSSLTLKKFGKCIMNSKIMTVHVVSPACCPLAVIRLCCTDACGFVDIVILGNSN
jgi:hypothetical protein